MSSETNKVPEMSAEMLRNTQDIAAQAALRAQQMLRKVGGDSQRSITAPDVPARGDVGHKAPEIPPKRQSLKKASQVAADHAQKPLQKPPPPLPQKPSSAQNSPQLMAKFSAINNNNESVRNSPQLSMRPLPSTPQMIQKFNKNAPASPQMMPKFDVEKIVSATNSPQFMTRNSHPAAPQLSQRNSIPNQHTAAASKPMKPLSPADDFSSEDALRGIESGLRNMERAMQEQMNMRSIEAANHPKLEQMQYNPMEFKSGGIRTVGSLTSLDGASQNIRNLDTVRLAMTAGNMRSMERGFSMDQMRLENLHHGGGGGGGVGGMNCSQTNMRSMESNPNIRSAIEEMKMKGIVDHNVRPVEHHMRSLDRSLPLELQYSRHRSQEVLDYRDQLRQMQNAGGMMPPNIRQGGLSREDLRMRRRSSHDENQISQGVPGN